MTKYQEMAKELVKQTRAQVLLTKTNFTTIAESLGVVRQTVSNNLDRDDIPLSMFLAAHPIGSLYWCVAGNPNDHGGTWKEIHTIIGGHVWQRLA